MKILIVDDERSIRNSLKEILEMEDYQVDTAENGADACEMAEKEKYDAIFCDIKMPGMDGTEVLQKLIADGVETPVVMISGHADIDTAVDCIKKGAFDFIGKPFPITENFANTFLSLPIGPHMPAEDANLVARKLGETIFEIS